jgi:putative oxygen-independent coproporphyrinogen III oxidase
MAAAADQTFQENVLTDLELQLPPLALYVHFPWCVRKCPYCDFNSHTLHGALPEADYVDALLNDLALQTPAAQGRELHSIFLGGGTPSLFSPRALARLLDGVRDRLACQAALEITLEANPGTIERGRFADYRAAGVSRVSLGAQSFDAQQLQRLGRIHSADDTRRAVEELHAAGLTNFNLDLMYGLPGQRIAQALADVEQAVALQPAHLSHYQLTLEPGTVFAGRPPAGMPDTDLAADMQLACQEQLAAAQFQQYEVSAYARAGAQCRHNLNYWQFGDYLGIGAGAHGKCTRLDDGVLLVERSTRPREPRRYLASLTAADVAAAAKACADTSADAAPAIGLARSVVPAAELPFEFLLNALRLNAGFEQREFEARTGLALALLDAGFALAQQRGLLEHRGTRWRASALGFNFLNDLLALLLPPAGRPASATAAAASAAPALQDFPADTNAWA